MNTQENKDKPFTECTKREMVAMHAMQALLSDSENVTAFDTALEWRTNIIEASVEFADLLLAELERTK